MEISDLVPLPSIVLKAHFPKKEQKPLQEINILSLCIGIAQLIASVIFNTLLDAKCF